MVLDCVKYNFYDVYLDFIGEEFGFFCWFNFYGFRVSDIVFVFE